MTFGELVTLIRSNVENEALGVPLDTVYGAPGTNLSLIHI